MRLNLFSLSSLFPSLSRICTIATSSPRRVDKRPSRTMQLDLFLREDAIVLAPTEDNPDIYTLGTIWKK